MEMGKISNLFHRFIEVIVALHRWEADFFIETYGISEIKTSEFSSTLPVAAVKNSGK
jgi:hypothetical protein